MIQRSVAIAGGYYRTSFHPVSKCKIQGLLSPGDSFLFDALEHVAPIRASVEKFDLSGHANREELLNYLHKVDPRAVVLSHGDPEAREWFEDSIYSEPTRLKVVNPLPGKTVEV